MKRVDFIGAAGVGKTTIIKNLLKIRYKNIPWVTCSEAKREVKARDFKKKKYSARDYFEILGYLLKGKWHIPIDSKSINHYILNNFLDKEYLLDVCLRCLALASNDSSYIRAKRIQMLMYTIEDIILLERKGIDKTVVFDHSLSRLVFQYGIDQENKFGAFKTKDIINKKDLPDSFVYLRADASTIINRIEERNKINASHRLLGNNDKIEKEVYFDLKKSELAYNTLISLGVNGIVVNASNTIGKNSRLINKFLSEV